MTAYQVTLDPPAVASNRTSLDLNNPSGSDIAIASTGVDWGQAAVTAYESEMSQWGSGVIDFRVPNRIVTIPLLLGAGSGGQDGFDNAMGYLREKVALFQREGGWIQRGDDTPLYADIVSATLTLPDATGETGAVEANVILTLECLPDFYGDPITLDTITASGETSAILQSGGVQALILGDHPGRAVIAVTDSSGEAQYGCWWAFRARHYDPAGSAALVYPAATSLTPGAGASVAALTGARGGDAIVASASGSAQVLAGGVFTHVGSYQIVARVYSAETGAEFSFEWSIGDNTSRISNPQILCPGVGFYLLNLAQVQVDQPADGTPQWYGNVFVESAFGNTVALDMLYLVPLDESAGSLQGVVANTDPVLAADGGAHLSWQGAARTIVGDLDVYHPVGGQYGDLPRIPPSGMEGRPVQLLFKPSRGDLGLNADAASQDAFSVAVTYRPSYIFRP